MIGPCHCRHCHCRRRRRRHFGWIALGILFCGCTIGWILSNQKQLYQFSSVEVVVLSSTTQQQQQQQDDEEEATTEMVNATIKGSLSTLNNNNESSNNPHHPTTKTTTTATTTTSTTINKTINDSNINNINNINNNNNKNNNINNNNNNNNKTLVVLLGNLRGGEVAWHTLYRNVLDVNSADLALMIGSTIRDNYQNATLFQRAKYQWIIPELDDWGDAIDSISMATTTTTTTATPTATTTTAASTTAASTTAASTTAAAAATTTLGSNTTTTTTTSSSSSSSSWRQSLLSQSAPTLPTLFGGVTNYSGSGAIVFSMRWFLSQRIQELQLTHIYDRFIITRTDHYYQCPHDISTLLPPLPLLLLPPPPLPLPLPLLHADEAADADSNDNNNNNDNHNNHNHHNNTTTDNTQESDSIIRDRLWIPRGEKYHGICDRHLVVSAKYVLKALDIFPPLLQHPQSFPQSIWKANPETVLQTLWDYHGLNYSSFGRCMFCVAQPGDVTRWTHGGGSSGGGGSGGGSGSDDDNGNANDKKPRHKKGNEESKDSSSRFGLVRMTSSNRTNDEQPPLYYKYKSEYKLAMRFCAKEKAKILKPT
jgi:uncharacterized membrane protein YgcG